MSFVKLSILAVLNAVAVALVARVYPVPAVVLPAMVAACVGYIASLNDEMSNN